MKAEKAFTLVELLVVVIIVGVLAAVSVPLMQANIRRARSTEAIAALGMIRVNMRLELAEHGVYNNTVIGMGAPVVGNVPNITAQDLTGTWFVPGDYTIQAVGVDFFEAQCTGTAAEVAGIFVSITENGVLSQIY